MAALLFRKYWNVDVITIFLPKGSNAVHEPAQNCGALLPRAGDQPGVAYREHTGGDPRTHFVAFPENSVGDLDGLPADAEGDKQNKTHKLRTKIENGMESMGFDILEYSADRNTAVKSSLENLRKNGIGKQLTP